MFAIIKIAIVVEKLKVITKIFRAVNQLII